ncbi:MAG: hypothetical protein K2L11_07735 [Muribaculaceae bacterium]|nr:hypothetical protein [Muribaculaceae bacterium]
MKTDLDKLNQLREVVEDTFGRKPGSPTDFDNLSYQIFSTTGNKIGVSTLKRFWGYVKSPYNATHTTLSVLARYIGFRDWDSFCSQYKGDEDSCFSSPRLIIASELSISCSVYVEWESEKWLRLIKIDQPNIFEVKESNNIKLSAGDIVSIDTMIIGEKFIARDCRRNGVDLGTYIGARKTGIQCQTCKP